MATPSATYVPRQAGATVLYEVVRDHFETFRAHAASLRDGQGLPAFVEQEFRDFLGCGWPSGGFARFRCQGCGFDRLLPFSCHGRGFCPSCGGRRMAERAAHLVDHVFPRVPVRHWVLSLPHRLRFRLAWDHTLCRAVLGRTMRAILGFLRRRARDVGVTDGRSGAVTIVQRFGGALNANVHFHMSVLDGVFAQEGDTLRFHPCPWLDAGDVADVLVTVEAYLHRLLGREVEDASDQSAEGWADEAPVLAGLAAASVQGRTALGPRAGARVRRCGNVIAAATTDPELGPCHARHAGFDLHAGVCVEADERDRLERVTRYALRPPVAQERLAWTADGQVRLELRRPWSDGTTHLLFDPVELLERLAALVPRPRINLILYYGVLGPRAAWRSRVVQYERAEDPAAVADRHTAEAAAKTRPTKANYLWAELMQRTLGLDVLACPRCGGRLRLIALIDDPAVVQRILRHLNLPTQIPAARPARSPPLPAGAAPVLIGADDLVYNYDDPA